MSNKLVEGYKTDNELAAELHVHKRIINRWADAGLIVETRLGNLRLIDVKASRAALAARARNRGARSAR